MILLIFLDSHAYAQDKNASSSSSKYPQTLQEEAVTELPLEMPGKFSATGGNLSPTEKGNVIGWINIEQSFEIYRSKQRKWFVAPYLGINITKDTKDLTWNNRAVFRGGIKISRLFKNGIIEFGSGIASEKRFYETGFKNNFEIYADTWFGRDLARYDDEDGAFKHKPATVWASIGNRSPYEGNNFQFILNGEQGITLLDKRKADLVFFGHGQIATDTKGFDWNNKLITGLGLKIDIPRQACTISFGVEAQNERRFKSGLNSSSLIFFTSVYYNWTFIKHR